MTYPSKDGQELKMNSLGVGVEMEILRSGYKNAGGIFSRGLDFGNPESICAMLDTLALLLLLSPSLISLTLRSG
jgi:hypothetical protein